ncbi:MAG: hypothetical protein SOZ21_00115 [Candidatus Cryptobacteroides sp.]|nr:hypothetical protein [Candidatus Cryptobacteroides sp.]
MADKKNEIRDDEFRVIGHAPQQDTSTQDKRRRNVGVAVVSAVLVIAIGILAITFWPKEVPEDPNDGLFENIPEEIVPKEVAPLGIKTDASFTEKRDTVINDVQLALYIPHNTTPELTLGVPDRNDKSIILAAQAADIRRDNRKILGAFVLKGEPLAWGLSKKGFCSIIDGVVTVGYSENSLLFEEAVDKGGYFFRQFALVDNGRLVENDLDNKTMRKALCSRSGQIFIAVSETDESMHNFAQALVDLEVDNAIYLVGSHSSFGWFIDENGEKTLFAPDVHRGTYKNENYIVWKH